MQASHFPRVALHDRVAHGHLAVAANDDAGYDAFKGEFEALAAQLFGDGASVVRADADESRKPLAALVTAENAGDIDALLARLER